MTSSLLNQYLGKNSGLEHLNVANNLCAPKVYKFRRTAVRYKMVDPAAEPANRHKTFSSVGIVVYVLVPKANLSFMSYKYQKEYNKVFLLPPDPADSVNIFGASKPASKIQD